MRQFEKLILIKLLYKSGLKAETDGLPAGQSGYAFETTTSMRKQGGSPNSECLQNCVSTPCGAIRGLIFVVAPAAAGMKV